MLNAELTQILGLLRYSFEVEGMSRWESFVSNRRDLQPPFKTKAREMCS
jgi:hypothetical protein